MRREFEHCLLRAATINGCVIKEWHFGMFANTLEEVEAHAKEIRKTYNNSALLLKEDMPDGRVNHYIWDDSVQIFVIL